MLYKPSMKNEVAKFVCQLEELACFLGWNPYKNTEATTSDAPNMNCNEKVNPNKKTDTTQVMMMAMEL